MDVPVIISHRTAAQSYHAANRRDVIASKSTSIPLMQWLEPNMTAPNTPSYLAARTTPTG